jgi:hypothetical protein
MGRMGGFVRGRTKVEAYKKFRAEVNRKEADASTGLSMDAGEGIQPGETGGFSKDSSQNELCRCHARPKVNYS